jgi:hypothetical protein
MTKDRQRLNRPTSVTPPSQGRSTFGSPSPDGRYRRPRPNGQPPQNRRSRRPQSQRDWKAAGISALRMMPRRTWNVVTDWRFFTLVGLALTGGLTALSIAFLFKLPALPNCPAVFWPLASGSLRLHCAQLAASKETVPDLLEAIKLLNTLGPNHPLYAEASRQIEQWSTEILELAEKDFQEGRLKQAIDAARKIPSNSSAAKLVNERVKTWEKIWGDADKIYNKVGELLKKSKIADAQVEAARLLSVDNAFWQGTKYQELSTLIVATREDMTKLGEAERALDSGVVDRIVETIAGVAGIGEKSFLHKEAQVLLPKMGRRLLEIAQNALDRKDYNAALDIANRIPGNVNLGQEVDDFRIIASSQSKAWAGGVLNLEDAIAEAQRIAKGRPLYDKAQRLIATWQVQAQETARLDQAKQLAQSGDLSNAIAQASQLSGSNQAARDFVQQTQAQIQEQQDRPILNQADQTAAMGDEASLTNAIAQAKQISSGRSLHSEAQGRIQQWKDQIKRLRNQAEVAVIAKPPTAFPSPVVAPSQEPAVAAVDPAAADRQAEQGILEQARSVASDATPDGLLQAIGIVQSIPDASPRRGEAIAAVDQWSQQLVQAAQYQADFDVPNAIAIAQRVPQGTAAYSQAQSLISQWRQSIGQ